MTTNALFRHCISYSQYSYEILASSLIRCDQQFFVVFLSFWICPLCVHFFVTSIGSWKVTPFGTSFFLHDLQAKSRILLTVSIESCYLIQIFTHCAFLLISAIKTGCVWIEHNKKFNVPYSNFKFSFGQIDGQWYFEIDDILLFLL